MVIEDGHRPEPKSSSHQETIGSQLGSRRMAWPTDRLGAVIVDAAIVLTPIVSLLSSPLERVVMEGVILGAQEVALAGRLAQVVLALVTLFLYQTLFWKVFGATLGQLFFGLRVVNYHSRPSLSLAQSALRSAVWIGQWVFLFGFPFLTTFSHQFRRTWHDRLADTQVVSLRSRAAGSPGIQESLIINGIFAGAIYIGVLIISYHLLAALHSFKYGQNWERHLTFSVESCGPVEKARGHWPIEESGLEMAMALYAAGLVEESCLEPELDLSRFDRTFTGLDYLALAFVHAESSERSNSYLRAVCDEEESSYACAMSEWIRSSAGPLEDSQMSRSRRSLASVIDRGRGSLLEAPIYFDLWKLRHLIKKEDYPSALFLISSLKHVPSLMPFLRAQEVRVLWGMGERRRARDLSEILFPFLGLEQSLELSAWMCFEEMSFSCSHRDSHSCFWARGKLAEAKGPRLAEEVRSLLWLRENECHHGVSENQRPRWLSQDGGKSSLRQEAKQVSSALELKRSQKKADVAAELFLTMAQDVDLPPTWRSEAWRHWLEMLSSAERLADPVSYWRSMNMGRDRVRLGQVIMHRALELEQWELASELGKELLPMLSEEELFRGKMMVVSWNLGQRESAFSWLETLRSEERGPASHVREPLFAFDSPKLNEQFVRARSQLLRQGLSEDASP